MSTTQEDIDALNTAFNAWLENADYYSVADIAKTQAFITAGRQLLLLIPALSSHGGIAPEVTRYEPEQIRAEITAAQKHLTTLQLTQGKDRNLRRYRHTNYWKCSRGDRR